VVQREVKKGIEATHTDLLGRLVGYVGFIFGRLDRVHPEAGLIHRAIQYTQHAYDTLPEGGFAQKPQIAQKVLGLPQNPLV